MAKIKNIIGADEVGYGSLAGPLVIGAISADEHWSIPGLNDSKKLTDKQRRALSDQIWFSELNGDIRIAIAERPHNHIDTFGVMVSLKECYKEVAVKLYTADSSIIIDGNVNFDDMFMGVHGEAPMNYQTVVKADSKYPTVMAASIVAKVYRDNKMIKLAEVCPEYDWASNKGYGSPKHIDAIRKVGYSEFHRLSYRLKDDNSALKNSN